MSTRTIAFKVCDGCSRSDLFDDVEIVSSSRKRPYLDKDYFPDNFALSSLWASPQGRMRFICFSGTAEMRNFRI
jgi:hypothetical protein